ncbi:MAG TPA: hypothetical protein VIW69_14510, partial [Candidatus Elarobacter sp.]
MREDRSSGALGYAADVFAAIAGADHYVVRTFVDGAPAERDCAEADRDWAALLRDLQLRDEPLPSLVVRSRSGGAMFLVFGRHGGPLAVIRLHVDGSRGFRPAQIAETRRFLDEHGDAAEAIAAGKCSVALITLAGRPRAALSEANGALNKNALGRARRACRCGPWKCRCSLCGERRHCG